jgi:hypothetical protein
MGRDTIEHLEFLKDSLHDALSCGHRSGLTFLSDHALGAWLQQPAPAPGHQPWWIKLLLGLVIIAAGWMIGRGALGLILDFMKHLQLIDGWSPGRPHDIAGLALPVALLCLLSWIREREERNLKELRREVRKLAFVVRELPWSPDTTPRMSDVSR